ncbi:MAG: hypothetical protein H6617_01965 [Bdellovibrionaceae bacterium]|nr:hypothetical protein [Pseudobdellovibrionaceae bacterium]
MQKRTRYFLKERGLTEHSINKFKSAGTREAGIRFPSSCKKRFVRLEQAGPSV